MLPDDDVCNEREAARIAGFPSVQALLRSVQSGQMPTICYWRIGRQLRFSRSWLLVWSRNCGLDPIDPSTRFL
jgi:hypothetical protein